MNIMERLNQFDLTPEQYEDCLQTIIDKKNGLIDIDWNEIVQKYNLPIVADSLRRVSNGIFSGAFVAQYMKESKIQNVKSTIDTSKNSDISFNKDGTMSSSILIKMTQEQSKDPDYILKAHGFSEDKWDISSYRNTVRQAISKQNSDGVETLYASYITVKPKKDKDLSLKKIGEFFDKLDRNYSLPEIKKNYSYLDGDKLLLIDIADLHMNLQATMLTAGNDYNCEIAEQLFFYVINDVLSRTERYDFDEIVFIVGGDMLNGDNLSGSTTKGTPQDSDISYYDAYERLCAMSIKAIDVLKDVCKVNVIYVKGNHDELAGFKLAKYVDAWFRNENRVVVDYTPLARKYKLYGNTLLCFAHDGKVQKLPALIADEARQYWSQADTVEVFLQHLHTEQVLMEDNNIRIQRLPTISGRSKWSTDKGYSSKRQCKSFIFDKEDGMTDIIYTPIKVKK